MKRLLIFTVLFVIFAISTAHGVSHMRLHPQPYSNPHPDNGPRPSLGPDADDWTTLPIGSKESSRGPSRELYRLVQELRRLTPKDLRDLERQVYGYNQ